jgi:hypothetical protein
MKSREDLTCYDAIFLTKLLCAACAALGVPALASPLFVQTNPKGNHSSRSRRAPELRDQRLGIDDSQALVRRKCQMLAPTLRESMAA